MTNNKMPKVGERYRVISHDKEKVVINVADLIYFDDGSHIIPEYFWNVFEEIPNKQEERLPEVGREYIHLPTGRRKILVPTQYEDVFRLCDEQPHLDISVRKSVFRENFIALPDVSQKPSEVQIKQDEFAITEARYKDRLSDEVREAMEELKEEISNLINMHPKWIRSPRYDGPMLIEEYRFFENAQNLLNALESMDKSNIPEKPKEEMSCFNCGKVCKYPISFSTGSFYNNYCSMDCASSQVTVRSDKSEKGDCGIVEDAKDWKDVARDVADAVKEKIKQEELDILFGKNQPEEEDIKENVEDEKKKTKFAFSERANKFWCLYMPEIYNFLRDYYSGNVFEAKLPSELDEAFSKINSFLWFMSTGKVEQLEHKLNRKVLLDDLEREYYNNNRPEEEKKSEEAALNSNNVFITKQKNPELFGEEKPKSIWRDVSELPERYCDVIISYDLREEGLGKIFGYYNLSGEEFCTMKGDKVIPYSEIKEYCTLTDLLIDYESEKQKRIELEQRINKLEENK